ncbi:LAETG motif-containing sortase-dependent surface protein [Streptomyces sp. CAU 1734]|uniref:LAETG motif-containing sortase-dependent surface protein n=1 Tax=Streptomyces sp. CAU 1734 TaxID=3140360 RepID=UPI00326111C9
MFATFSELVVRGRGGSRRLAAAVLLPGLVVAGSLAGAGAAAADDGVHHQGGAVASLDGLKTFDRAVLRVEGRDHELPAGLSEMTVEGGGRLKTYGADIQKPAQEQARYLETAWDQTSLGTNRNAGKIRWILRHSYPLVDDLAQLAKDARTGPLTPETAAAGTQVAIWRHADGSDVRALDPAAEKLADWLERQARNSPEPRASLSLEPAAVTGLPGDRLGPVTVRTDADRVDLIPPADTPASGGATVTDAAGKPLTSVVNGAKVYFDIPADAPDATATLTARATTSIPVGRAFSSTTRSQIQILAGSSESAVSARTSAGWAKTGPIPAVTDRKNCAKGGVDITAGNNGDAPFTFELAGTEHTVPAGATRTVTLPVAEDQAYDFTVTASGGFSRTHRGVLDCLTIGAATEVTATEAPVSQLAPASVGGGSAGLEGDLAATGGSGATPLITGGAITLVVIGGAAVFLLRKKKSPGEE